MGPSSTVWASRLAAMIQRRQIELGTLLIIAASYALVYPVGEYAIDDDWAYVRSLAHLHTDSTIRILDWNPMSLVGHLFWGLLFAKAFGLSFTITKMSVVALSYLECVGVIGLLRHCKVARSFIWIAVLTLTFNPLHFVHSFMYGTDIPAITWTVLALLFYVRALGANGHRQLRDLVVGSTFAGLSFLVRQNGFLVCLALVAYLVLWDRRDLRSPRFVLAACGPAAVMILVFRHWYLHVHGPTSAYTDSFGELVRSVSHPSAGVTAVGFFVCMYLGFFLFPLAVAVPLRRHAPGARSYAWIGVVLAGVAILTTLLTVALHRPTFPYLANKITPFGYLRPNEILVGERDVLWTAPVFWTSSLAFGLSFVALAVIIAGRFRAARDAAGQRVVRLSTLLLGLQIAYLLVTHRLLFDRHLLILCPTVIVLACALLRNDVVPRRVAFAVLLLPLVFYSIAGTHDIHSMSRVAFRAGQDLMKEGIDVHRIDAGYAFDGWYVYGQPAVAGPSRARSDDAWWIRQLYPSIRTDYVVSLSPTLDYQRMAPYISGRGIVVLLSPRLDRYSVYRIYSYRTYWPPTNRNMYVLVDQGIQSR